MPGSLLVLSLAWSWKVCVQEARLPRPKQCFWDGTGASGEPFCLGVPCLSFALPGPQFFSHLGCAALAGGSHEHSGRMLAPCLFVPPLCSLPCPTHPFGTPQLRAAAFLGDALPECTRCCQRLKNVNVSASLEAGKN